MPARPARGFVVACACLCTTVVTCLHAQPVPSPVTTAPVTTTNVESLPVGSLADSIRNHVDDLRYDRSHDTRGARIVLDQLVARYYEAQQFQPAWQPPGRLETLIACLGELRDDGLDPEDYHFESLRSYYLDLRLGRLTQEDRADLDLLATDSLMLALYHLYLGKVDPLLLDAQWNYAERPLDLERGLQQITRFLADGRIREAFDAVRPQHPWYQRGRERLREYRAIAAVGGWPTVPEGPTLKPGMTDTRVPVLRKRLAVTHDLPVTAPAPVDPSSYDTSLVSAVENFQARHGLAPDGVVGAGTRAEMNVPVEARIDQIRVNLERGRWVLHEIKGEFVLVDVAGFYVSYFRGDEPVWTSKVVVGRDERSTPIFRSTITYVVFNPTWTIPPGILVKDKLPELQRDAGALKRMNIRVLDSQGREVDPYSVDWRRYGPTRLPPYQFRQDAGPNNALGVVKIMFPNPYHVYLHDSPAKSLYDKDQRTFSSGCIRVEKPLELAELVLKDPQWNATAIEAVIDSGQTRTVTLKKSLPVLILYWTAQPRADGQVVFRKDVYGRDAATLAALDGAYRVPAQAQRAADAARAATH